jgi:hypothetical protein
MSLPLAPFETLANWVRRKQLTEDGNVEITGRDLREREVQARRMHPEIPFYRDQTVVSD